MPIVFMLKMHNNSVLERFYAVTYEYLIIRRVKIIFKVVEWCLIWEMCGKIGFTTTPFNPIF